MMTRAEMVKVLGWGGDIESEVEFRESLAYGLLSSLLDTFESTIRSTTAFLTDCVLEPSDALRNVELAYCLLQDHGAASFAPRIDAARRNLDILRIESAFVQAGSLASTTREPYSASEVKAEALSTMEARLEDLIAVVGADDMRVRDAVLKVETVRQAIKAEPFRPLLFPEPWAALVQFYGGADVAAAKIGTTVKHLVAMTREPVRGYGFREALKAAFAEAGLPVPETYCESAMEAANG